MPATDLLRTPLYALHRQGDAKFVAFAGVEMPLHYATGIIKEHLHTRSHAGLFDVSHMGTIRVRGTEAAAWLETLLPVDVCGLGVGQQRYALLTNAAGGVVDDLMVQNLGGEFRLVVNAGRKHADLAHLQQHLAAHPAAVELEMLEKCALLALQGPKSAQILGEVAGENLDEFPFMAVRKMALAGADCTVSRSGYTGEDGFEIALAETHAEKLARYLLAHSAVQWVGLGARDSLRLEAGLCLYGHELDATTTPLEADLGWAISKIRRSDGARAGGFLGADVILAQLDAPNSRDRVRVGLQPEGRAPVREGAVLLAADGAEIGRVSSGGFSPSLQRPICMGYVPPQYAKADTRLHAMVRGRNLPLTVVKLPFVAHNFKR